MRRRIPVGEISPPIHTLVIVNIRSPSLVLHFRNPTQPTRTDPEETPKSLFLRNQNSPTLRLSLLLLIDPFSQRIHQAFPPSVRRLRQKGKKYSKRLCTRVRVGLRKSRMSEGSAWIDGTSEVEEYQWWYRQISEKTAVLILRDYPLLGKRGFNKRERERSNRRYCV